MIFPLLNANHAITLSEPVSLELTLLMLLMFVCFCAFMSMERRFFASSQEGETKQYVARLLPFFNVQNALLARVESISTGPTTGLTANEKNSYQRSPERRSSSGDGRWPATLRSGRGSPIPGTKKIQRIQR